MKGLIKVRKALDLEGIYFETIVEVYNLWKEFSYDYLGLSFIEVSKEMTHAFLLWLQDEIFYPDDEVDNEFKF